MESNEEKVQKFEDFIIRSSTQEVIAELLIEKIEKAESNMFRMDFDYIKNLFNL